jgi:hypothetical protein
MLPLGLRGAAGVASAMCGLAQKRTLRRVRPMSANPPKADIAEREEHVR